MNDSFGDFSATQTGGNEAASEKKSEGIVSVLIKQILLSPEGNFQMYDMSFSMVTCVAIVRSVDTFSTKVTYKLEDSTGTIDAHYWLEDGAELTVPNLMVNNYVKVFGSVRSQGGKKTLMVFKILPVSDPNEVCTHILEVLNSRYRSEEFASKNIGGDSGGYGNFGIKSSGNAENFMGLEGKQLAVYQAIKNNNTAGGIHRKELQRKFTHINEQELNSIIEFFISEGHIYSSTDVDHFLTCE